MRRSYFLKYICILTMLAALVRFFFGIMLINFYATANTFGAVEKSTLRLAGVSTALNVLCAAALLACGFLGALNWEEPLNAGKCARWGLAALLLGLGANFLQAVTGYGVSYVAWITGALAPALYLFACLHFRVHSKKER